MKCKYFLAVTYHEICFFLNMFLLIPILIDSLARTCHKNTIKSAKSGPERMLSHRCTQATPPMGLILGIPWGIERLKYSPEEDTGSDGTVASHSTFYTLNGNFRVSLSFSYSSSSSFSSHFKRSDKYGNSIVLTRIDHLIFLKVF